MKGGIHYLYRFTFIMHEAPIMTMDQLSTFLIRSLKTNNLKRQKREYKNICSEFIDLIGLQKYTDGILETRNFKGWKHTPRVIAGCSLTNCSMTYRFRPQTESTGTYKLSTSAVN